MNYHSIVLPTRSQPDTIVAIFLLKKFGKEVFPGVLNAEIKVLSVLPEGKKPEDMEKEGYILIDIGGGIFDHHGKVPETCASILIAKHLGIFENPALKKMIDYAERDDRFGKGTVSEDMLDRAFGLSGLIAALNKKYSSEPIKVIDIVLPLIEAHFEEENKRFTELPEELEKAKKENKVQVLDIKQKKNTLKVILIESNNVGMPGFLRSSFGGKFDVVVQRGGSGHVNILTRPMKRPDIRLLAGVIRATESQITNNTAIRPESIEAQKSGRSDIAPNWYFDPATNSLQNGGVNPSSVVKTVIPWELFPQIIEMGLSF